MEEIIALKDAHIQVTHSQLKELLQKQVKLIDHVKSKQNRDFSEDETKIEELTSKIESMKETLRLENEALERKNRELSKHSDYVKELQIERNKYMEENQALELRKKRLRHCKPNLQDQQTLDQGRKRFKLYKDLTRIRWDYEALKENVKGYVSNKSDYIHYFCYKNGDPNVLTNLLWQEIYRSTTHGKTNSNNKENVVQNT